MNSVARSPKGNLLVTGDDFGKVKLYRYPAVDPAKTQFAEYCGHSSHVACVRWAQCMINQKMVEYVISVGGEDKCIFQWRHTSHGSSGGSKNVGSNAVEASNDSMNELLDLPKGGDEFTAVKPWLGAIVAPTGYKFLLFYIYYLLTYII